MPIDNDPMNGFATIFPVLFGIVAVIVVGGAIFSFVMVGVRAKRVADAGHNPLTLETDLALRVLDSQALAPAPPAASPPASPATSVDQRLSELEALRVKGAIDDAEYATMRRRILESL